MSAGSRSGQRPSSALTVLSATSLQVTVPAHASDTVDVRVVSAYGTSPAVKADRYTYLAAPPPTISTLTEGQGLGVADALTSANREVCGRHAG